jgi:hypothetical protein
MHDFNDADTAHMAHNPNAGAEKLFVRFGLHPRHDEAKSLEEGRPIFEEVEYVEIMVPGDKSNTIHRPVTAADRNRFRAQYQAWKSGADQDAATGTPLSAWPAVTSAQVAELAHFNCRTVEQLATMSDSNLQGVGPILALRQKARDFIEAAKGTAPVQKLRAENDELKGRMSAMQAQLDALVAAQGKQSQKSKQ